ncbi:MAG: hypothetical protein JO227_10425 [Acetobacteraceae bacterium]|nr:hypothetical protein [Acetobacteraceae bacterium]
MLRLIISFLPWIILGVLGERLFLLALVLALVISGITTGRQIFGRSLKILETATFAFFVFITVGILGFGWIILATYMTLIVNLTLSAIAWGSLLAGVPFTIQYAREQVPPEFWRTTVFMRVNQYITAIWGLDFLLCALVSLYRHATGDTSLASQYAWVPLSVGAAIFTVHFPGWYRARRAPPGRVRRS